MIEKTINGMTAIQLRMILIGTIIAIFVLGGLGFYFVQAQLNTFAVDVSHANEDASTSNNDIAVLQSLQKKLESSQDNVARTKKIVADSKSYTYQDQIISDLNAYAARAGITIASYTFNAGGPGGTSAAASAGASTATAGQTIIPGLKSTTVSVNLKSPTKYDNLLNFVHSIEQNLTKMQIAGISLTKGQNSSEVSTNALSIEVYIQ
jgi:hypothetical protein